VRWFSANKPPPTRASVPQQYAAHLRSICLRKALDWHVDVDEDACIVYVIDGWGTIIESYDIEAAR
jgi:hypothetical protein